MTIALTFREQGSTLPHVMPAAVVRIALAGTMSLAATGIDEHPRSVRRPAPSRIPLEFATADDGLLTALVVIEDVRLESPLPPEPTSSSILKFDVVNDGDHGIAALVLEVSIVQKSAGERDDALFVVHPFKIRGSRVLAPGQAISYELLLRNLSADCHCIPHVNVLSVRPVVSP